MPVIVNQTLYNQVKDDADKLYKKPSAYKSGWIVKTYKERGGTYEDDNQKKNLQRWFKEQWGDIGGKDYPVYRPTKRITKDTPLTVDEIDPKQAKKQIALKQIIKGESNLPPFYSKDKEILKWSNPSEVLKKKNKYLGEDIPLYLSSRKDKKYMVLNPTTNKFVHFGQIGYEDFTKSNNLIKRDNYLKRSKNIKGDWKDNKYSPNNLSINILW